MHLRMTGNLLLVAGEGRPGRPRSPARASIRTHARPAPSGCCSWTCAASGPATCCWAATRSPSTSTRGSGWSRSAPTSPPRRCAPWRAGRKQPVKAFLLNQERIAGVGNIYADEALFRARIHPLRPVGTLKRAQIEALRDAVVESLELGIDSKGASIDDYRHVDGAQRELPGPLPRAHARGRAVPALRHADPEAARGGAGDLRVPSAASRGRASGAGARRRSQAAEQLLEHRRRGRPRPARGSRRRRARPTRIWGKVIWPVRATSSARPDRVLGQVHLA